MTIPRCDYCSSPATGRCNECGAAVCNDHSRMDRCVECDREIDPSLKLIQYLAQALQAHHLGLTTTEPFAKTYDRDLKLLDRAEDFLSVARGELQAWHIPEIF